MAHASQTKTPGQALRTYCDTVADLLASGRVADANETLKFAAAEYDRAVQREAALDIGIAGTPDDVFARHFGIAFDGKDYVLKEMPRR